MQTIFAIAQSDLILQLLAGLGVILLAMILSTHGHRLRPFFDIKYALPAVLVALSPLAIIALVKIFQIVLGGVDAFGDDKRGYTILLAALAGAPFVIWRTWIAQKQGVVAEQGHMTDRIAKAVEQLGAEKTVWIEGEQSTEPNLEVRVGAIYALERISQDSMRDHISVMEILCAYVRNNAPDTDAVKIEVDTVDTKAEGWQGKMYEKIAPIKTAPIDIQTALSVIGRRKDTHIAFERDAENNPAKQIYNLDLSNTNLQKLDLSNAKLDNAKLDGAQLQGADLSRAQLQGADFFLAQLQGANFFAADTRLAIVKHSTLDAIFNLTEKQVRSMFGDSTTTLPDGMTAPEWAKTELEWSEFDEKWRAAIGAAGL